MLDPLFALLFAAGSAGTLYVFVFQLVPECHAVSPRDKRSGPAKLFVCDNHSTLIRDRVRTGHVMDFVHVVPLLSGAFGSAVGDLEYFAYRLRPRARAITDPRSGIIRRMEARHGEDAPVREAREEIAARATGR